MRNQKQPGVGGILCFLAMLFWLMGRGSVQAAVIDADAGSGYVIWSDNQIEAEIRPEEGKTVLSLSALQADGQETVYAALIGKMQWNTQESQETAVEGIKVAYETVTAAPFYVTVELRDARENRVLWKEDAVFGNREKDGLYLLKAEEGQYKVGQTCSGILHLPFSAFSEAEDNDGFFEWDRIESYTIGIVMPSECSMLLKLGMPEALTAEENVLKYAEEARITGPDEMELPVHGESIAGYGTNKEGFQLFLSGKKPGVSLLQGTITLDRKAEEGTLRLKARNADGVTLVRDIKIVEPRRSRAEYIPDFPEPEELVRIEIPAARFHKPSSLKQIRITAAAIGIILAAVYAVFYRKAMQQQKEEE